MWALIPVLFRNERSYFDENEKNKPGCKTD